MNRPWLGWALLGLTAVAAVSGCATVAPSASVTTTQPGAARWFRLDWTLDQDRSGSRRVTGYIYNDSIFDATNVRVLVQALDASGAVVEQRLEWVGHPVAALSRVFFEAASLPTADHYRVTVWSFDFIQRPTLNPFYRF